MTPAAGLRPIGEIVAELIPKLTVRFLLNEAMNAVSPSDAVKAFVDADNLRQELGLSWSEALAGADRERPRNRSA